VQYTLQLSTFSKDNPRRLEAKLHLFQNKFGLALNWGFNYLSGVGVEWRKPGDVDRIAASSDG
jgi:hypothetical protein